VPPIGIDGAPRLPARPDVAQLASGAPTGSVPPSILAPVEPHPPVLTGRLVRLRAPEPADESLNELFNDHEVRSGIGMPFPQPVESYRDWISTARKAADHLNLAIERLEEPGAVGMCDLMKIEAPTRTAELGVWIARPWWRGGYGTDAVRTLCRFGFDQVNLHRITLYVNAGNAGAIGAYEKVGFVHEGRLGAAAFVHGTRDDLLVMGLLPGDLRDDDRGRDP
jgi:RimJ/RimL family protein N-acetyltransferase